MSEYRQYNGAVNKLPIHTGEDQARKAATLPQGEWLTLDTSDLEKDVEEGIARKRGEWAKREHWLLRRIRTVLRGVEDVLAAFICNAVAIEVTKTPGGGVNIEGTVRWWNPAAWIACLRVCVFRDSFGCAYFGPQKTAYDRACARVAKLSPHRKGRGE